MTRTRRAAYPELMAIDRSELADDFGAAVTAARQALASKGELSPPNPRPYVSPLDDEERGAILELLRSGAYAQAAAAVSAGDPDLSQG